MDGNKRTALLTLLYELDQYSFVPNVKVNEFERLTLAVAANKLDTSFRAEWKKTRQQKSETDRRVETIFRCLKRMTKRKDTSFHIDVTPEDLIAALSRIDGCKCYIDTIICLFAHMKLRLSYELM